MTQKDLNKLTKKELIALNEKLSQQASSVEQDSNLRRITEHEAELEKISRMADMSNPNKLPFSIKDDHKNIILYTALNKAVGPLHPTNAEQTMKRWRRAGIQLYTTKRTPEQVESYMQTDQYKTLHAKHVAMRKKRHAMSEKGKADKMVAEIAGAVASAVAGKQVLSND